MLIHLSFKHPRADEITPEKFYTPERREEIDELWADIAALAAEITA